MTPGHGTSAGLTGTYSTVLCPITNMLTETATILFTELTQPVLGVLTYHFFCASLPACGLVASVVLQYGTGTTGNTIIFCDRFYP